MPAFSALVLFLGVINCVLLGALAWHRVRSGLRRGREGALEGALKPLALAVTEGEEVDRSELSALECHVLDHLLLRYARLLRGEPHERIVGYFKAEGAVGRELEVLVHSRRSWRRAEAAFRLGDIAPFGSAGSLVAALSDGNFDVRLAAARSLGRLRDSEATGPLLAAAAARAVPSTLVRWAILQIGAEAVAELQGQLTSPNAEVRRDVVQLLGLLGGLVDTEMVAAALGDEAWEVRCEAAFALGRLGRPRDVSSLLAALQDPVADVRLGAAHSLGSLREMSAVPALEETARWDDFDVARQAAYALARISPRALEDLGDPDGDSPLAEAVDFARLQ